MASSQSELIRHHHHHHHHHHHPQSQQNVNSCGASAATTTKSHSNNNNESGNKKCSCSLTGSDGGCITTSTAFVVIADSTVEKNSDTITAATSAVLHSTKNDANFVRCDSSRSEVDESCCKNSSALSVVGCCHSDRNYLFDSKLEGTSSVFSDINTGSTEVSSVSLSPSTTSTSGGDTIGIPFGWKRIVDGGTVLYFSPTNCQLSSIEQVSEYLQAEGTCKCGLECPLLVPKVFNFNPEVPHKPWTVSGVTSNSNDITKLCNHKRKIVAMAALQRSTTSYQQQMLDVTKSPMMIANHENVLSSKFTADVVGNDFVNKKDGGSKRKLQARSKGHSSPYDGVLVSQLLAQKERLKLTGNGGGGIGVVLKDILGGTVMPLPHVNTTLPCQNRTGQGHLVPNSMNTSSKCGFGIDVTSFGNNVVPRHTLSVPREMMDPNFIGRFGPTVAVAASNQQQQQLNQMAQYNSQLPKPPNAMFPMQQQQQQQQQTEVAQYLWPQQPLQQTMMSQQVLQMQQYPFNVNQSMLNRFPHFQPFMQQQQQQQQPLSATMLQQCSCQPTVQQQQQQQQQLQQHQLQQHQHQFCQHPCLQTSDKQFQRFPVPMLPEQMMSIAVPNEQQQQQHVVSHGGLATGLPDATTGTTGSCNASMGNNGTGLSFVRTFGTQEEQFNDNKPMAKNVVGRVVTTEQHNDVGVSVGAAASNDIAATQIQVSSNGNNQFPLGPYRSLQTTHATKSRKMNKVKRLDRSSPCPNIDVRQIPPEHNRPNGFSSRLIPNVNSELRSVEFPFSSGATSMLSSSSNCSVSSGQNTFVASSSSSYGPGSCVGLRPMSPRTSKGTLPQKNVTVGSTNFPNVTTPAIPCSRVVSCNTTNTVINQPVIMSVSANASDAMAATATTTVPVMTQNQSQVVNIGTPTMVTNVPMDSVSSPNTVMRPFQMISQPLQNDSVIFNNNNNSNGGSTEVTNNNGVSVSSGGLACHLTYAGNPSGMSQHLMPQTNAQQQQQGNGSSSSLMLQQVVNQRGSCNEFLASNMLSASARTHMVGQQGTVLTNLNQSQFVQSNNMVKFPQFGQPQQQQLLQQQQHQQQQVNSQQNAVFSGGVRHVVTSSQQPIIVQGMTSGQHFVSRGVGMPNVVGIRPTTQHFVTPQHLQVNGNPTEFNSGPNMSSGTSIVGNIVGSGGFFNHHQHQAASHTCAGSSVVNPGVMQTCGTVHNTSLTPSAGGMVVTAGEMNKLQVHSDMSQGSIIGMIDGQPILKDGDRKLVEITHDGQRMFLNGCGETTMEAIQTQVPINCDGLPGGFNGNQMINQTLVKSGLMPPTVGTGGQLIMSGCGQLLMAGGQTLAVTNIANVANGQIASVGHHLNTPMPPLSIPNVTTVTGTMTQVIPAVGVAQQILGQPVQPVVQFLNTFAMNAMQNPVFIQNGSQLLPQTLSFDSMGNLHNFSTETNSNNTVGNILPGQLTGTTMDDVKTNLEIFDTRNTPSAGSTCGTPLSTAGSTPVSRSDSPSVGGSSSLSKKPAARRARKSGTQTVASILQMGSQSSQVVMPSVQSVQNPLLQTITILPGNKLATAQQVVNYQSLSHLTTSDGTQMFTHNPFVGVTTNGGGVAQQQGHVNLVQPLGIFGNPAAANQAFLQNLSFQQVMANAPLQHPMTVIPGVQGLSFVNSIPEGMSMGANGMSVTNANIPAMVEVDAYGNASVVGNPTMINIRPQMNSNVGNSIKNGTPLSVGMPLDAVFGAVVGNGNSNGSLGTFVIARDGTIVKNVDGIGSNQPNNINISCPTSTTAMFSASGFPCGENDSMTSGRSCATGQLYGSVYGSNVCHLTAQHDTTAEFGRPSHCNVGEHFQTNNTTSCPSLTSAPSTTIATIKTSSSTTCTQSLERSIPASVPVLPSAVVVTTAEMSTRSLDHSTSISPTNQSTGSPRVSSSTSSVLGPASSLPCTETSVTQQSSIVMTPISTNPPTSLACVTSSLTNDSLNSSQKLSPDSTPQKELSIVIQSPDQFTKDSPRESNDSDSPSRTEASTTVSTSTSERPVDVGLASPTTGVGIRTCLPDSQSTYEDTLVTQSTDLQITTVTFAEEGQRLQESTVDIGVTIVEDSEDDDDDDDDDIDDEEVCDQQQESDGASADYEEDEEEEDDDDDDDVASNNSSGCDGSVSPNVVVQKDCNVKTEDCNVASSMVITKVVLVGGGGLDGSHENFKDVVEDTYSVDSTTADSQQTRGMKRRRCRDIPLPLREGNEQQEEESPSCSPPPSEPRSFNIGDLVWGQIRGFPSWPGKLVREEDVKGNHVKGDDAKLWVRWFGDHTFTQVEPEKLKTLMEGLESHHRARKKHRRGRKMNSNLENAIQEAMLELDKQQDTTKTGDQKSKVRELQKSSSQVRVNKRRRAR